METLLGIPMGAVARTSVVASAIALAMLVAAGLRRPLLVRLALRGPSRRPLQSALITLGLALSAIVVSTALHTGDTMTHTVRILVASGLGRADEVILALPRDQRRSPGEYLQALMNGTLLTGLGGYFPEELAGQVRAETETDDRIAGLLPAIGEQVTAVNLDAQTVHGPLTLLALPVRRPAVFGAFTSQTGEVMELADVGRDELLANTDAAGLLGAAPGAELNVRAGAGSYRMSLRAVTRESDLGGAQPTLYARLDTYQELTGRVGRINQILVANRGERANSVLLSADVARSLRVALADRAAAARLFDALSRDAPRREIAGAAQSSDGRLRDKLESLARALGDEAPSDEFISLITDPDVERRLTQLAGRIAASGGAPAPLSQISPLRVVEIKQFSQDQADRWGGAITSTFLILGLFSITTGGLLVFLIFVTLAAERRSELGVLRALGAHRRDVILLFVLEGALYDVVGSAVGLGLGALLTVAITNLADTALSQYGVRLEPRLEARSLVVAYCAGWLLTLATVGGSAWQISRVTIVNAIRNLPEPAYRRRPRTAAVGYALLVAVGISLVGLGWTLAAVVPQAIGVGVVLLAIALLARRGLGLAGVAPATGEQVAFSCYGIALVGYWLVPPGWGLIDTIRPLPRGLDIFFVAGVSMVLGAVWLLLYNLSALTRPLVAATSSLRSFGLALRTAIAHPLHHRLRTGMVAAMFALVIFSMVLASVLLTATHRAYDDPEAIAGGFDVRAELTVPTAIPNFESAVSAANAVRLEDFVAIGRLASRAGQVLELTPGVQRWRPYSLNEIDAGFAAGLRAPLGARAAGYSSDADVWHAVTTRSGLAVAAGPAVRASGDDPAQASTFRFAGLTRETRRLQPTAVWVRDERGGPARRVEVIGVLDQRIAFPAGIYVGEGLLTGGGTRPPQREARYLKARPEADPATLALGLNLSLGELGVRASALGEDVRRIQSVRTLLNELLQGFFGVGLLAGLAALGLITMRSVLERRQQIGLLRALGFRRRMVRFSLLLETSLVALIGIGLGVLLGLSMARRVAEYLGRQYPEIVFSVPWTQIALVSGAAYAAALLFAAVPLWQIGRIEPAEALTYE